MKKKKNKLISNDNTVQWTLFFSNGYLNVEIQKHNTEYHYTLEAIDIKS